MSYSTLHHLFRELVLAFLFLGLPVCLAQSTESPNPPANPVLEPETQAASPEPATHPGEQTEAVGQAEQAPPPVVRVEPPPPQVIQVQMPTVPILSREELELLVGRMTSIENRMVDQQTNATAMVIRSNQTILTVAAILGGLGLLGILGAAIILMRAFNRFSDVMLTLPMAQPLGRAASLNALAVDDLHPTSTTAVEQASARFLGALEQLEKRVRELETEPAPLNLNAGPMAKPPGNGNPRPETSGQVLAPKPDTAEATAESTSGTGNGGAPKPKAGRETEDRSRHQIQKLLEEGEALLQSDKFEDALTRFDEALALQPRNPEALIKRGMTLERLQRMEAALESYDRAIATNGSLTLAYLHKGAICNRLQRYREALECYERALQAEQKS